MARKKRKSTSKVGIDDISNFSDNVMCHILSRLSTKDAVRTCVLSQRWKYKYTSIYEIYIDDYPMANISSFHSFMEKVLTHDDSTVRICSVVFRGQRGSRPGTRLPRNFLHCVSLTRLKLSLKCVLKVRVEICFPNLKSLYLEKVKIQNNQSSKRGLLSLTFPVMQVLETRRCKFLEAKKVKINAPQLITFICGFRCEDNFFIIEIEGPKLVELALSNDYQGDILQRSQELQSVTLECQKFDYSRRDLDHRYDCLLMSDPSLKCLKLSAAVAEVLVRGIRKYARPFAQIRRLEIFVETQALLKLLEAMPCLEVLKLNMLNWQSNIDEQDQETLRFRIASHSHLKEIELINFMENNNQLHLINLILGNAKSLERVTVCSDTNVVSKLLHDSNKSRTTRPVREDLISSLPDEVIFHILSCLPTKDAVKTSALAQQWKYKYVSVYNLDIEVDGGIKYDSDKSSSLDSFIIKSLTHYDSRILSFRLVSRNESNCSYYSKTWIPQILDNKVQHLILEFGGVGLTSLPVGCASLTTLNISTNTVIQFPDKNCFPNLKSLYLSPCKLGRVLIQNELLIFPALEVLDMRECAFRFPKVEFVEINVPELITFKYEYSGPKPGDCKIMICGPKISKLHYCCGDIIVPGPYWKRERINQFRYPNEFEIILASKARALLIGAPSLKCLKLSRAVAKGLVVDRKNDHVIPSFHQLERLEISCHPKDLLELLQLMPCLESLKLNIPYWHDYKHKNQHLSHCITPCLKEVEFIYFYSGTSQMDLIKLFVENVKCLERVTVCRRERPRNSKNESHSFWKHWQARQ